MHCARHFATSLLGLTLAASVAGAQGPLNQYGNPPTLTPRPTRSAIDEQDLRTRIYTFADDSMQGRQIGRAGNLKGTDYIARELQRLGLVPAGDDGTYFQVLPYHLHEITKHSRLTANGTPFTWLKDWVAVPGSRAPRAVADAEVIFGGVEGDTTRQISAAQAAGKFVVLLPGDRPATPARGRGPVAPSRFEHAAAVAVADLDALPMEQRASIARPEVATNSAAMPRMRPAAAGEPVDSLALARQMVRLLAPPASIRTTREAAARLFNRTALDGMAPGSSAGTRVTATIDFLTLPSGYARNVVAIIPGSDPVLRHQYVAVGAHNDHVGFASPVDKDSIRAFNIVRNRMLLANDMITLTPEQLATIRVNMDSIRRVHPVARLDSINNGADDDGSGSMGVLEIAEAIQAMPVKPKRSTLFVWHTGEEAGLIGSAYFTANPTVPLDSVVAQINVDMIGRGRAEDIPGGGPNYLGVVGASFDSRDLGELVEAVNRKQGDPLKLDHRYDTTLTWSGYNNIYGRSDHYMYALKGIPIAFFFTGLHGDYHQRSDEPEYLDYPHYAKITRYIGDLVVEVGNAPRPRINGTRPARPTRPAIP